MIKTNLIQKQKQQLHQAFKKHHKLELEWRNPKQYFAVMIVTALLGMMVKSNLSNILLALLIYTISSIIMLNYHHFQTNYCQYRYKHLK